MTLELGWGWTFLIESAIVGLGMWRSVLSNRHFQIIAKQTVHRFFLGEENMMRFVVLVLLAPVVLVGCSHEPTVQEPPDQKPTATVPIDSFSDTVGTMALTGEWSGTPYGPVVQSADQAAEFPQAALACKLKMGAITESESGSPAGSKCDATCEVIS
jgi:hypothetical protein